MSLNKLPREIDSDKLAEAALAILSLTLHDGGRVWKGLDWDLMDLLHEKGWIVDPQFFHRRSSGPFSEARCLR
jgi:hypothetical protein